MISNNHLTYAQSVLLLSSVFMTNSVMNSSTLCDIGGVKVKPAHFRIVYILSFHGHHCLNRLCLFFKGTFFATLVVFMSTYELKQNKKNTQSVVCAPCTTRVASDVHIRTLL